MKVGFTGTQRGMTILQKAGLRALLGGLKATELHHGDCIGADAEADAIAHDLGLRVVIHPPENPAKRAFCKGDAARIEKPYLVRNHDIVDETEVLIAGPLNGEGDDPRSGTWATIRYAQRRKKRVHMLPWEGR